MRISNILNYIAVVILITLLSCSHAPNEQKNITCTINLTRLWKNDSNRLKISERRNRKITQLVDKKGDSVTFGVYDFYSNGQLQSYRFFVSDSQYAYKEELDSVGNITVIEGSPVVTHLYRKIDSSIVEFTFLFSSLNTDYKNITVKTNTGVQFPANLLDNAVFTSMKSVTFYLPVAKTFNNVEVFTTGDLINTCLKKQWTLKDTVSFKRAVL